MMKKGNGMTPAMLEKMEQERIAHKKLTMRTSFEFYINNSASIEILRNDNIELVFFIVLPHMRNIPKE
jgi:inositol 1,4,5-triphosphate receptor type 1/inositol 1,4,5-triphosphate receptor type 3